MARIVKLILVEGTVDINSNKFYLMEESSDGSKFTATWGRVGSAGSKMDYPLSDWQKKYTEKVRKGYEDVTELVSLAKSSSDTTIKDTDSEVEELVHFLQDCAKKSIKENYTVAVGDVTEKQLLTAQNIIDNLTRLAKEPLDLSQINHELLKLYKIIPRKMNDTRNYILSSPNMDFFTRLLKNEQDLLDTLASQVTNTSLASSVKELTLEFLGLKIQKASKADRDRIEAETDFKVKNQRIFVVENKNTSSNFKPNNVKLFYHGSRNENWFSIIQNGLKIKPVNAIHTGSMFGSGIYFANKAIKSIGYTSLRGSCWSNGTAPKAYLALFEVSVGKQWDVLGSGKHHESWMTSLSEQKVKAKGFDSLFAKGGADLRNDEFVVFNESQCTIKYLVELTA